MGSALGRGVGLGEGEGDGALVGSGEGPELGEGEGCIEDSERARYGRGAPPLPRAIALRVDSEVIISTAYVAMVVHPLARKKLGRCDRHDPVRQVYKDCDNVDCVENDSHTTHELAAHVCASIDVPATPAT